MFLLAQIWIYLLLMGLIGLVAGWFLRGCVLTARRERTDEGADSRQAWGLVPGGDSTDAVQGVLPAGSTSPVAVEPEAPAVHHTSMVDPGVAVAVETDASPAAITVEAASSSSATPKVILVKRRRKPRRKEDRVQVISGTLDSLRAENAALRAALAPAASAEMATDRYLAALDRENARLRSQLAFRAAGPVEAESVEIVPLSPQGLGLPYPSRLVGMGPAELEATLLAAAPGLAPAPLAARPADGGDDLKAIVGVGRALEKWLHGQGIYTFRQIACMSPAELYWLVEALPHSGARVYRENWVTQADRLMRAGQPD
jgi:predicted flap endonuclease-1-like 5' DNA nuclease